VLLRHCLHTAMEYSHRTQSRHQLTCNRHSTASSNGVGNISYFKQAVPPPQYAPAPSKLTFDLLTLKVVSESRVTWATSVPILVFLGLSFST